MHALPEANTEVVTDNVPDFGPVKNCKEDFSICNRTTIRGYVVGQVLIFIRKIITTDFLIIISFIFYCSSITMIYCQKPVKSIKGG